MDERIKVHLKSPRPSLLPGGGEGVDVSLSAHLSIYLNVSISLMGCSDSLTGVLSSMAPRQSAEHPWQPAVPLLKPGRGPIGER